MAARSGIKKIVVGVDGSPHSAAALDWAVRMAKGMGAEIVAVYSIYVPVYFPEPYGVPVQFDEEWRAQMKAEFETKWCEPLKAAGVSYRTVFVDGRPATVILDVANREDADIIIVGRRGRGGVAELVLGSVSHELAVHSRRPLLLIEPEAAGKP
ncbi:MAG TPA: universal stress protein [Patescibacteria group bacterium]|jgi:nucleotide-binding universal stress UspA family protein|nr:universal stress protein [Patescibacteria group bacterium]